MCTTLLNCYLIQLLETGFLHADPHPGNLIRTPDGKICILDFGLMTEVSVLVLCMTMTLWLADYCIMLHCSCSLVVGLCYVLNAMAYSTALCIWSIMPSPVANYVMPTVCCEVQCTCMLYVLQ